MDKVEKLPKWAQKEIKEIEEKGCHLWPTFEKPEPMVTVNFDYGRLVVGWFANYNEVSQGCSDGINHSRSRTDKTETQTAGTMYHSKLDALKVIRWEKSQRFAKELNKIDRMIEKEMNNADS